MNRDHAALRERIFDLMGASCLPIRARDAMARAYDATDIEAALYRTADALVLIEDLAAQMSAVVDKTRAALLECMAETGAPNIALPHHTVGTQERRKVIVTDPSKVPLNLWTKPEPQPDTGLIRQALAAGETVPGAHLSNGQPSLFIRKRNTK